MKKTILILIGIILLGGGVYLFVSLKENTNSQQNSSKENTFRSFFPFSANKENKEDTIEEDPQEENVVDTTQESNIIEETGNNLFKVTDFAISGFTIFQTERLIEKENTMPETKETESTEIEKKETNTSNEDIEKEIIDTINYVEKSTGHIYEYPLDTKKSAKISNSTIPGVHESFFANNNESVVYRYLNNTNKIQTYIATFGAEKGEFLQENIDQLAFSPDKNNIFYLYNIGDKVFGIDYSFKTKTKKQIFTSEFTEWIPQWINKQAIYMTTKPSYNIEGSLYGLNISNGALTKIFGNIQGLTTLASNDGSRVLYNKSTNNGPLLNIFKNNTQNSLSLYGLPEKCVWSKDNINIYCALPTSINTVRLPDLWYQGKVSFDDMIVKINTENLENSLIYEESSVDAINLKLNANEDTLFFVNKKDNTLWMIDLN